MHDNLIRYGGDFVEDVIVAAEGSWVTTADGGRILDFTAGQICATIGHNHPRVGDAIRHSLGSAIHLNSWMLSPPVLDLAEALVATLPAGLDRTMLLSTGGESIEVAVRMAKLHTGRFEVASLRVRELDVLRKLGQHTEARLVGRPPLEPDARERDALLEVLSLRWRQRRILPTFRFCDRIDAGDL